MYKQLITILTWVAVASSCWAQGANLDSVSDTQGVSLAELTRTMLAGNKDLQAARESMVQAEARLQQAPLRPNPSLEISKAADPMFANEGDTGSASRIHSRLNSVESAPSESTWKRFRSGCRRRKSLRPSGN